MNHITHYPLLVLLLSFVALSLAAMVGVLFRERVRDPGQEWQQEFNVVLAATLTLLGLIIGFSFSMATSRYDLRKTYEEAEANAIGTAYVRADLLTEQDAAKLRSQLKDYLALRVQFYLAQDEQQLTPINARTGQLQSEMWSLIQRAAKAQPTPIMGLAVSGMNDILNSQGYTQAAYWNRIPTAAWGLMAAIALCCNLLLGLDARKTKASIKLLLVVPSVVSVAFMLIADIDAPRHGVIRVVPQNLISLGDSLRQ
jgi:hypothetical protein